MYMKKYLLILLLAPLLTFAQVEGELVVGENIVTYDRMVETDTSTMYFSADDMVASKIDGITMLYEYGRATLEAHDTDNDGTLDVFLTLDKFDQIKSATGTGVSVFERPAIVSFDELRTLADSEAQVDAQPSDDLVGSVSSIKIPRYHNWKLYVAIVLLAGGGFWWYRKRKEKDDNEEE